MVADRLIFDWSMDVCVRPPWGSDLVWRGTRCAGSMFADDGRASRVAFPMESGDALDTLIVGVA